MNIQIQITDRHTQVIGAPVIVCGNSDYKIQFIFDSEWADKTAKTALFVYTKGDEVQHTAVAFEGTEVDVPILENITEVRVGVYVGDHMATTPAVIPCVRSIRCTAKA